MDPDLRAAAQALSAFDPLEALRGIALREDATALALRGVAMAQLGEFTRARKLLARAARAFGDDDPRARARALAAEAEVALATRDLAAAGRGLEAAAKTLEAVGDRENATFARLTLVRRSILLGKLVEAEAALSALALERATPRTVAVAALLSADIAVRSFRAADAETALERARIAARAARIRSLYAEVERAFQELHAPVARLAGDGPERPVVIRDVEALIRSERLLVDACRREVRSGTEVVSLKTRPVLLSLAVTLAGASPAEAPRGILIRDAFGGRTASESLRARLRVEMGRLRRAIASIALVRATPNGFSLTPRRGSRALLLLPPAPGVESALLALLGGDASWSTSALAEALGSSQRSVQRALGTLAAEGKVRPVGSGRSRKWVAPPPEGFATTLLLVAHGGPG